MPEPVIVFSKLFGTVVAFKKLKNVIAMLSGRMPIDLRPPILFYMTTLAALDALGCFGLPHINVLKTTVISCIK